jgi:hypothetical protein
LEANTWDWLAQNSDADASRERRYFPPPRKRGGIVISGKVGHPFLGLGGKLPSQLVFALFEEVVR